MHMYCRHMKLFCVVLYDQQLPSHTVHAAACVRMISSTDYVVATRVALVTNWEGTSKACNSNTTVTLEVASEKSTFIGFVIAGGFEIQSKYMYQKRFALPDMTRPTTKQSHGSMARFVQLFLVKCLAGKFVLAVAKD